MSVSGTAISSALNALKMYSRQVDRAAQTIATAGLGELPPEGEPAPDAPVPAATSGAALDLSAAMTSMMIAQRAFSAQLRVLKTADQMLQDTVETLGPRR